MCTPVSYLWDKLAISAVGSNFWFDKGYKFLWIKLYGLMLPWYQRETVAEAIITDDSVDLHPGQKDDYGSTPLSIVVRHSHTAMVKHLMATGTVTCDSHDCFGRSVSWWAKTTGNGGIGKMVVDYSKKRGVSICGDIDLNIRPISRSHTSRLPLQSARITKICDACTLKIPGGNVYHRCETCNGRDFDICMECYELGGRCLQDGHGLIRMRDDGSLLEPSQIA